MADDQYPTSLAEPRRRRIPRPKPLRLKSLPFTIRYGLPAAVIIFLAVVGYRSWAGNFTYLSVVGTSGAPVARGTLEFFVYDDSRAARSPTAKLGELTFEGSHPRHGPVDRFS